MGSGGHGDAEPGHGHGHGVNTHSHDDVTSGGGGGGGESGHSHGGETATPYVATDSKDGIVYFTAPDGRTLHSHDGCVAAQSPTACHRCSSVHSSAASSVSVLDFPLDAFVVIGCTRAN
jgi:hypothetical protein